MSYPPIQHHSTTPISTSEALSLISAYLEATITDASLHPNALLTENGPTTPAVGESTGLILHNLRRVEAGLKGENLGADLTFKKYGGEGLPGLQVDNAVAGATEIPASNSRQLEEHVEGEWQDKEEFERQQDIVEGEIGARDNAVHGGHDHEGGEVPKVKATYTVVDKEARKREKKKRIKELKSGKGKPRREQSNAEY